MTKYNAYDLTLETGLSNLELEKIISKDCHYSYVYAKNILKGRFELGEYSISKDCCYSWDYAISVLKCRFRLGEKAIIQNMHFNYYCNYLVKVMRYNHA